MNHSRLFALGAIIIVMIIGMWFFGCSDDDKITEPDKEWGWEPLEHGILGEVYALQVFNDKLYAGGSFQVAGGEFARNIAAWDGIQWTPLGYGTSSEVRALTVYGDELIAGGFFGVAAYDGADWSTLGNGLQGFIVKDLCVLHDSLFAVGASQSIEDHELIIAAWDGSTWTMIESGTPGYAKAICVYQDNLIVGGEYIVDQTLVPYVKRMNSGVWQDIDPEHLPGRIYDLTVFNDDLFVAGQGDYPVKGFSLTWDKTGSDAFGYGTACVYSLFEFNGSLVAGGNFTVIGTDTVNRVASRDGSDWSPLGAGITEGGNVFCVAVWKDNLYVGGGFTEADGVSANSIARWSLE